MAKIIQADGKRYLPSYWEDAKLELMKRDRILRKLIPQFGDLWNRRNFAKNLAITIVDNMTRWVS